MILRLPGYPRWFIVTFLIGLLTDPTPYAGAVSSNP